MEYNQILEDANKEKAVNARAIEEWEKKHNKLKLEEIEYVILFVFVKETLFYHLLARKTKTKKTQLNHRILAGHQ